MGTKTKIQPKKKATPTVGQTIPGTSWVVADVCSKSSTIKIVHSSSQESKIITKKQPTIIRSIEGDRLSIVRGCKNKQVFLSITDADAPQKSRRKSERPLKSRRNRFNKPLGKKSRK